ncbi:MAG: pyridoxal 5'-phosphate synthase glutaminase subunit PdxT [Coriobacteriales bacterium]|nr:pyridoxal 5'-phosphate synthase glutaminase subunit PdxT [Coriobacteriales bacterium]
MATAVLALQGAFVEHKRKLDQLGEPWFEIREKGDLDRDFDRLVLPGGESTTQGRLLRQEGLLEPLRQRIAAGLPVLATCAGLILLAARIQDQVEDGVARTEVRPERHLGTLDVTVVRNAYGRQLGSFRTQAELRGVGQVGMTFIRAPYISEVGPRARTLATVEGRVVAVRQGVQLALSFHPELEDDLRIHQLFCRL